MRQLSSVDLARRVLTITTLALALVSLGGASASAAEDERPNAPLVGAWTIEVTLRNCDSNVPLGPPFRSLVTFHGDGTISEAAGSVAFAPGQRSPGHGAWTRQGRRTYRQSMVAIILFTTPPNLPGTPGFDPSLPVSPGFAAGWQTISHTLTLTDADHATSAGTNAFFDVDGNVYRTGCSTAVSQRFQ